jgi:hypothetical protein
MKTVVTVLIAGSLALNLALLALLFAGRESTPAASLPTTAAPKAAAKPAAPPIDDQTWSTLRTEDLPAMVNRLRENGFPPATVRAIMATHLREAYAARIKALDPEAENRPFWKSYSIDPKVQAAQSQLYREQTKILRGLLGPDAEGQENINALYQGRRFDSVPPEKIDDVQRILRDFEDARQDVFSKSAGSFGQETQKRITEIEKDQRAALARLLTPQEFEDWQVRNSDTARSIRAQLSAFNPTEAEFRAIYKLQADYDEKFSRTMYAPPSPEESRRRGEAEKQLNEQIKATLGPVRGAEYERSNDYNYRQTSQLVARLELPPETTGKIYEIQKDIQNRSRELYRGGPNAVAEREKEFAQLISEAQTKVSAILGPRGFEAYRQYGGSWIQSLQVRPAIRTPAPAPAK